MITEVKKFDLLRSVVVLGFVWYFSVILLNIIYVSDKTNSRESAKTVAAKLTHPNGYSLNLRKGPPRIGFGYELQPSVCLIPNNTSFQVIESQYLPNKEVWHKIFLKGGTEVLRLKDQSKQVIQAAGEIGWILGANRENTFVKLEQATKASPVNATLEFVNSVSWLILGAMVGLIVWKVVSHQTINDQSWNIHLLGLEAGIFSAVLIGLAHLLILRTFDDSVSAIEKAVPKAEQESIVAAALDLFSRGSIGAFLVGFLVALFASRVLSIAERQID